MLQQPSISKPMRSFGALLELSCDRLAQAAFLIIALDMLLSVIFGVVAVIAWPDLKFMGSGPGGGNGIPGIVVLAATAMGAPSFILALVHAVRGEWRKLGHLLPFVGPALIFFGFFFVSHAFDPCGFSFASLHTTVLGTPLCQPWGGGLEIHSRFHLLHHALIPTVFLVYMYWLSLRRWHPTAARFSFLRD